MVHRVMIGISLLVVTTALAVMSFAGFAQGSGGGNMAQAQAADWNCAPESPIGGYFHCAPPGKPSVLDIVTGKTNAPSIVLRVFNDDSERSFAGIESLLRADLYAGQPCPQDNLTEWGLLDLPVDYRACHRFDA